MMATNLTRLRKPSAKGAPPTAETAEDVIATDPRALPAERQRPLQVRIPESVFAAFSERAGREYSFTHGAKKQLFLKMWAAYEAQNME